MAFAEQIQKQMAISGASGASAQAALVQLTQGLASGTLRGEELNSVLEQTPMIAQTIAEYMGVTIGEMRELASEGKVTAEVVKNAMLGAAEETNAQFEQMPMTWAQVWTMFQNVAIQALDPVLDAISWLANNIDLVGPIVLGLGAAFGVFLLAANWTNICTAATTVLTTAQKMLMEVMGDHLGAAAYHHCAGDRGHLRSDGGGESLRRDQCVGHWNYCRSSAHSSRDYWKYSHRIAQWNHSGCMVYLCDAFSWNHRMGPECYERRV